MQLFKKAFLAGLLMASVSVFGQQIDKVLVYNRFSDFEEKELFSNKVNTRFINFWATWCKPCVKELPYFQALHEKYPDLDMLLVSLDKINHGDDKISAFLNKRGITIPCVVLADGRVNDWIDKVSSDWSGSIPATLIIHDGKKYFYETDFESLESIEKITNIHLITKKNP